MSSTNGPTLRHRISVPDSSLRAGYQITANGGGTCTLGFTAIARGEPVFVSNSHCSRDAWSLDHGSWGQPYTSPPVGVEIRDPGRRLCLEFNPAVPLPFSLPPFIPHPCRDADAALIRVHAAAPDIALGQIARTTDRSNCEDCSMPLDIDEDNSTIEITSFQGFNVLWETLHKIGRTTGWTYGYVVQTCVDWFSGTFPFDWAVINCNDVIDYSRGPGDSGSPVFAYNDGTAQLRGIHWGYIPAPWNDGVMSDLVQIGQDLGSMWILDPGPPSVYISGPSEVPPETACRWDANTTGMTPLRYLWSGVLHGTASYVHDIVWESGWLKVEVTDPLDRSAQDSIYVTVVEDDGEGQPPIPPPGCER